MSSGRASDRMPLSEWIGSFQTFVVRQQWCEASLIQALRLCCSLADEICKIEIETGRSPEPRLDWINSIVVYLQSNKREGNTNPENVIDRSAFHTDDVGIRVEILPSLFAEAEDRDARRVDRIVYSLGIVFYEIFSGGERPAELKPEQTTAERPNGHETWAEDLSEAEGSNTFSDGKAIDFSGDLMYENILSDYNFSEEDYAPCDKLSSSASSVSSEETLGSQRHCPRKKRTQKKNFSMCSVSVEPLKESLPQPLCDLIANMLDCASGSLSSEDTYHDISEVRDDLHLMLDKPSIYLYEQDMGKLSTTGLQLPDTVFGRSVELSAIKKAYRRAVEDHSEVVTINGASGTGKSRLAAEFGKYVLSDGGILLSGKFDQLQQGEPFSALASALNDYCGLFLQNCELASSRQKLADQINQVLKREVYHLVKLIPNLARILGEEVDCIQHDESCSCFNAQKRIQYLLCMFVEVISSIFAAPVVLFLDDLQWADEASVAAVNQLLLIGGLASQNTHFFFLGCFREEDADSCNPPWKVLCENHLINAKSTNIELDCMNEETVNTMVSETLGLSPRLIRSLSSTIYHKTKGNPLFVSRLLCTLNKDDLLRPSLSRQRWEWDLEKIQSQKLPDDVAIFLSNSIEAQTEDVLSSLCVLSCFGSSVERTVIELLESSLQKQLLTHLDEAVEEGLLDKRDEQYYFSHDRIQEAAYKMMNILDRCHIHFKYGMALAPSEEDDDSILLTAVSQFNLAGVEAIQRSSQNAFVANLNLRAGKKSMEMSDFVAAYSYFDIGISFLKQEHWHTHYALSLELFDLAANCALTNGDMVSLKLLYEQVLHYGRTYEDKLNVLYFFTCALAFSSRLPESISMGLDILEKLGIKLRGHESNVEACVQETTKFLSFYTSDQILDIKRMSDPIMSIAMKFLGKLEVGMTQIMPKSVPFVTQQIIQLSLLHGMSPVSPVGFAHFGSCIAKLGDISEGYRYVKLALSLIDKVGSRESAGEVICLGTLVRSYVEPLQATLDYHEEGYVASLASGDIIQAALNRFIQCSSSFFAGMNLQSARDNCAEVANFMYERKMFIFVIQLQCLQHSLFKLIGTNEKPQHAVAEEDTILTTNNCVMTSHYFHKAYVSFMFRSYDDAKLYAEKHLSSIGNTWPILVVAHAFHAFYIGLISFWVARKSKDGQRWREIGKAKKMALKKWAQSSMWTFANKWYLLEAEESYCDKDFDIAELFYEKAISSAKDHKFAHEEALAYELSSYFYLEIGNYEKAIQNFLQAHKKYHEWGAFEKCNSLFKFFESRVTLPASDRIH